MLVEDNSQEIVSSNSYDLSLQRQMQEKYKEIFTQEGDPDFCYYKVYCEMHLQSISLLNEINDLQKDNKKLKMRAKQISKTSHVEKEEVSSEQPDARKKRSRRSAGQITRHYICKYANCQKSYGSQGSLNQHTKLKHDGIPFAE